MKLSFEKFEAAKNYLMKNGRDLEQELYRFMGEGHHIYTNAMDTTMAFQYLSEVGATSRDEIVQKGIRYIVDSYDRSLKCWHPRPNEMSSGWDDNPGAELVGFLFEYRDLVPNDFLGSVTETALSSIRNPKKPYDRFYFLKALCILRLAARIDEPFKTEILDWLKADIFEIIETDLSIIF